MSGELAPRVEIDGTSRSFQAQKGILGAVVLEL